MVAETEEQLKHLASAQTLKAKLALRIADKDAQAARERAAAENEKKKLIERLTAPSGVSDEEATRRVSVIVERAVSNGLHGVQVYRFPNELCSDHGRAISQNEPGWESTLTGVPMEMYQFWARALRPLGYKVRFEIIEWPGGMPGDIGITLRWV